VTDAAIVLLKLFEGFSPSPYSDVAGHGTVGYGHLILRGEEDQYAGRVMGPVEAEKLLVSDFSKHYGEVVSLTSFVRLTEWELEALTSFAFNLGAPKVAESTLLKVLRVGDRRAAAQEFLRWRFAAGKVQQGLVRRRHTESVWFLGAAPDTLFYMASDGRL
jgi:lysozyme